MGLEQTLCGECMKEPPSFEKASAYGSYVGGLRDLIHLLKYDRVMPAAKVLGRMLAEAVTDLVPGFGTFPPLVVPVPLHPNKLRQRGFNQSQAIAQAAAKVADVRLELAPELLSRKRETESQTGLTRQQRVANLQGAFRSKDRIAGRDVLLVDDVFTTGTTASECARVLRRAGAGKVWVATVARVLKSEPTFAHVEETEERGLAAIAGR